MSRLPIVLYALPRILRYRFLRTLIVHPPRFVHCPICDARRLYICTEPIGWRCLICRGTAYHQGAYSVIRDVFPDLSGVSVYEISAHGALYNALRKRAGQFTCSEFLDGWEPGKTYDGIRCENIERLTLPDASFDLVTSTSLFEHVEDDEQGYREIARVLKPGGYTVFTVPYDGRRKTSLRARRRPDGSIEHLMTPEYHGDPFRGDAGVFTWRNYGTDIVEVMGRAGLQAEVRYVTVPMGVRLPVIVGRKAGGLLHH